MFSLDKSWGDPGGLRKPIHLNRLRIDPGGPHKQKNKHSQAAPRGCEQTSNKDPGGKAPGQPRRTNNKHNNRSAHVCGDAKRPKHPDPARQARDDPGRTKKLQSTQTGFRATRTGQKLKIPAHRLLATQLGHFWSQMWDHFGPQQWSSCLYRFPTERAIRASLLGPKMGPKMKPISGSRFGPKTIQGRGPCYSHALRRRATGGNWAHGCELDCAHTTLRGDIAPERIPSFQLPCTWRKRLRDLFLV